MSYKIDELKLIAYLYGELSGEEKGKVEAFLSENEDARKELEELKEARALMGKVKDREVEIPRFTFQQPETIVAPISKNNWWKYPMGIAASLALLLLIGYLTSFKLSYGDEGLKMAFGEEDNPNTELFSKSEVESLVANAIAANNQQIESRLDKTEGALVQKVSQEMPQVDQELLNEYMARLRNFNRETLASMLENSEQNQKDYTDRSMQDLAVYLDIQRQNDLDVIQTRFENFEDDAEFNQLRTNQILTNLISSVEEQPSNQY